MAQSRGKRGAAKWSPCPHPIHMHTQQPGPAKSFKQDPKQDQRERAGKGRVCHKRKQVTHKKTDNTKQKNMQLARAQHQNSSQEGAREGCLCAGQGGDFFPVCGALFPTPGTLAGVLLFPEGSPVT